MKAAEDRMAAAEADIKASRAAEVAANIRASKILKEAEEARKAADAARRVADGAVKDAEVASMAAGKARSEAEEATSAFNSAKKEADEARKTALIATSTAEAATKSAELAINEAKVATGSALSARIELVTVTRKLQEVESILAYKATFDTLDQQPPGMMPPDILQPMPAVNPHSSRADILRQDVIMTKARLATAEKLAEQAALAASEMSDKAYAASCTYLPAASPSKKGGAGLVATKSPSPRAADFALRYVAQPTL